MVILNSLSFIRNRNENVVFHRKVTSDLIHKAQVGYEKQDIVRTIRQSLCKHRDSKTEIRQDCVGNWCYFTSCPSCGALLSKERYYPSEILALYDDSDIRQISTKGRI